MINRTALRIQQILLIGSCVGYLIGIFTNKPILSGWRVVCILTLFASSIWHSFLTKCPHCGRLGGLKHKLSKSDSITCIHCGGKVTYQ